MYLMYLDDSGSVGNKNESHFILGGVIVHEDRLWYIQGELNKLMTETLGSGNDGIEIHCSEIFAGRRPPWNGFDKQERQGIIKQILEVAAAECNQNRSGNQVTTLISCAVNKHEHAGQDAMRLAFEDLSSRFQQFLTRQRNQSKKKTKTKGLIIVDKSTYENSLQALSKDFSSGGTRWGIKTKDILEVPLFVDSKASRGVQMADAVAYAVFRRYSQENLTFFNIIENCFDTAEGQIHGLCHKTTNQGCSCPACLSRRSGRRTDDFQ